MIKILFFILAVVMVVLFPIGLIARAKQREYRRRFDKGEWWL